MHEAKYRIDSLFDDIESSLGTCPAEHVRMRLARIQRALDANDASTLRDTDEAHLELVAEAQEIMMQNASDPLTIDELARACNTSPTMLKQTFRAVTGKPVYRWYRAHRIERACELLEHSSLTIAEIANAVGYSNPSKFSKAFDSETGLTPREWRKTHSQAVAAR